MKFLKFIAIAGLIANLSASDIRGSEHLGGRERLEEARRKLGEEQANLSNVERKIYSRAPNALDDMTPQETEDYYNAKVSRDNASAAYNQAYVEFRAHLIKP